MRCFRLVSDLVQTDDSDALGRKAPQIRHIEKMDLGLLVNILRTEPAHSKLFPDFSGRAMLFGAPDKIEI